MCCISKEPPKFHNVRNIKPQDWINSQYITEVKDYLANDKWPDSCKACELKENAGHESKRIMSNRLYSGNGIKYIDIRLGNTCNLRCQTCWPISSSKIAHDMSNMGSSPWDERVPLHIDLNINWQDNISILDSLISHGLEEIYITGGEPFLVKNVDLILEKLDHTTKVRFNTNGTIYNPTVFEILSNFNNVQIDVSIDAVGKANDYIRSDSVWEDIDTNIIKFKEIATVHATPTISVYNVLELNKLRDYCKSVGIECYPDELIGPSYMCISNAPDKMKQHIVGFEHLVSIPTSIVEQQKFIDYVKKIDNYRHTSIVEALPEVAKFYGLN